MSFRGNYSAHDHVRQLFWLHSDLIGREPTLSIHDSLPPALPPGPADYDV